jgi:predicted esterase
MRRHTGRFMAAGLILALLGAGTASLRDALHETADSYLSDVAAIARVTGRESTMDYYQRLLDDVDLLAQPVPDGYPAAVWQPYVDATARLDISLADQLVHGTYQPLASIRGLGETFVKSSKDGTMQPVAVYVPRDYVPGKRAALMVFLHGRPQSESSLIAPGFIRDLADRHDTILVAPYGRGYYDFRGSESDVYDALDAATRAFTIDPRKHYLAGYSMGAFSVFSIAPQRPQAWSAVMAIAGALLGSVSHEVTAMMPNTPFYVLTGSRDQSIPTQYPTATAVYLRNAGVPVTFYSDADATHRLYTLRAILAQAWSDMHDGIVRTPATLSSGVPLLGVQPPTLKP